MKRRVLWWVIIGLDALLLFFYVMGYLSAFLPPESFWWTGIPATVLPYLAVAVLMLAVVHLGSRRWTLCFLHVFLAALMLPRLPGLSGTPEAASAEAESPLIVMTYNVPPPQHLGNDREQVRQAFHHLVEQNQPHVLALQGAVVRNTRIPEAPFTSWHVDTLLAAGYAPVPQSQRPEPDELTHQSVFSRIGLLEKDYLHLLRDAPQERRATRAAFEWQDQEIVLFNVHLRSFDRSHLYQFIRERRFLRAARNFFGMYRRNSLERTEEVRALRAAIEAEESPVIVAGDFNSTPYHWVYRHIVRGLTDVHLAAGQGWGGTWHSRLPFVRIDHILVSPELDVISAQVLSADLSDHLPVVVELDPSTGN